MNTMQKFMKKNNKGFSLVELIVVILIIGILAVAIAPQVTKWVGTARTNQEKNELTLVTSGAQVALADALGELTSNAKRNMTASVSSTTISCSDSTDFETALEEVFTDKGNLKKSYTIKVSDSAITVTTP